MRTVIRPPIKPAPKPTPAPLPVPEYISPKLEGFLDRLISTLENNGVPDIQNQIDAAVKSITDSANETQQLLKNAGKKP